MPLPLPWFHPVEPHRTRLNSSSLRQPFRYLKAALMSPLSFDSRLNIALAAIAHMTWLSPRPCPRHFPLDGYQLFPVLLKARGLEALTAERSRTLTLFLPPSLSRPSLAAAPAPYTHKSPPPFSHMLLLSLPPALGFGQLRFRAQAQGLQPSVPIIVPPCWIHAIVPGCLGILGPDSPIGHWRPLSALRGLCAPSAWAWTGASVQARAPFWGDHSAPYMELRLLRPHARLLGKPGCKADVLVGALARCTVQGNEVGPGAPYT